MDRFWQVCAQVICARFPNLTELLNYSMIRFWRFSGSRSGHSPLSDILEAKSERVQEAVRGRVWFACVANALEFQTLEQIPPDPSVMRVGVAPSHLKGAKGRAAGPIGASVWSPHNNLGGFHDALDDFHNSFDDLPLKSLIWH